MTDPLHTEPVEVTQADEELGLKFWRVHPNEILATGLTRADWYAREIARHRTAAEAASRAREARLRGLIGDAYETLKRIEQGADEALVAAAAKEACDKIDAALSASDGGEG